MLHAEELQVTVKLCMLKSVPLHTLIKLFTYLTLFLDTCTL